MQTVSPISQHCQTASANYPDPLPHWCPSKYRFLVHHLAPSLTPLILFGEVISVDKKNCLHFRSWGHQLCLASLLSHWCQEVNSYSTMQAIVIWAILWKNGRYKYQQPNLYCTIVQSDHTSLPLIEVKRSSLLWQACGNESPRSHRLTVCSLWLM